MCLSSFYFLVYEKRNVLFYKILASEITLISEVLYKLYLFSVQHVAGSTFFKLKWVRKNGSNIIGFIFFLWLVVWLPVMIKEVFVICFLLYCEWVSLVN